MTRSYTIAAPRPVAREAIVLDEAQRRVVDHAGGPLLVLAGPGTGKTTTLVETVVHRIEHRGLHPDQVLVLTFSRKAAHDLRTRIAARLGRTVSGTPAMTFHSFSYALVREFQSAADYLDPVRLMSAPEQDAMIRELLVGSVEEGTITWPPHFQAALRTRGLAREVKAFMARAESLDMDPFDLAGVAGAAGRADWMVASRFFAEYRDVAGFTNATDYSHVLAQALDIARDPVHGAALRERYALVVVDEYQDTDPLQVALLKALAGGGRDIIAVGDPDQSIYAFRGADVTGILEFPREFATAEGPAPVLALASTRRFGPRIAAASRGIIASQGVAGWLDADTFRAFRNPAPLGEHPGEVIVQTYATAAAEAEHIALQLRRAHLDEGIPWSSMAVLVRSGVASIPRLQRALTAAGVPIEVAGDEMPLAAESSVRVLLGALAASTDLARGVPLDVDMAGSILAGPLCGLDAADVRRLARALRAYDTVPDEGRGGDSSAEPARGPRPSRVLLAEALGEPELFVLAARDPRTVDAARRARAIGRVLGRAARQVRDRVPAEQVLWTLWAGTSWPARLQAASEAGGEPAQRADRDLDALCALFDQAARFEEAHTHLDAEGFLDAVQSQELPADTLFDSGTRRDAVRLMTAHRSKGLEWQIVVVASVQETSWPDVRYRGSLLQSDRLGPDGLQPPTSTRSLLAEERRLFYVAVTRATRRLVVTAVESASESGDQPSRFVRELRAFDTRESPAPVLSRPARPLSLRGMIAALRRIGETTDSAVVRSEVASRLARLAALDLSVTRPAHPDRWWGVRDLSVNERPLHLPDEVLKLSGSGVSAIVDCPLHWFLEREARGGSATTSAQGFGSLIHALAADVVDRRASTADPAELETHLDRVWDQLVFAAPWIDARERQAAHEAIVRFARWHEASQRTPLAAEHSFAIEVDVAGETVVLRGSMDRVDVAADGRIHVVDFKTSKSIVPAKEIPEHSQLGFYQLAVAEGAVDELLDHPAVPGGAELVQLRNAESAKLSEHPRVQPQAPPDDGMPFFAYEQLRNAVRTIRSEDFVATPGGASCQYCDLRSACPAQPEGATILDEEHR